MSSLKRTLSLRKSRRSYKTLSQASKSATIKEDEVIGSRAPHITRTESENFTRTNRRSGSFHSTPKIADVGSATNQSSSSKTVKQSGFPTLSTVKSALSNIKQRIQGRQIRRVRLGDPMSVTNSAYVTPRRSQRIKGKSSPSPISLKMYSPFCIETPGMEDSFVHLSKRKALTDLNESPLAKTPRRMVKSGVKQHKRLAKSISSSQVTGTCSNGY